MTRSTPRRIARTLIAVVTALLCALPATAQEGGAEPLPDHSGRWVFVQQTVTVSTVAVVGRIRSTTRAVVLFDLEQDDDQLSGSGQLCELDIDSGTSMIDTILPAGFLQAVPTPRLDARLSWDGDEVRLEQPPLYTVMGADLDDLESDPLPTRATQGSVTDPDADGEPGVTVRVEGIVNGEVYVAQRGWTALDGTSNGTDRFDGGVDFDQEQVVLGATRNRLRNGPVPRPEPSRSSFTMVRVSNGATCDDVSEALRDAAFEWVE